MNAYLFHCTEERLQQFLDFLDHQHFRGVTVLEPQRLLAVLPRAAQGEDDSLMAAHRSVSDSLRGMMQANGIAVQAVVLGAQGIDGRTVTRQPQARHWLWVSPSPSKPTQSSATIALWSGHFLSHSTVPVPGYAALS